MSFPGRTLPEAEFHRPFRLSEQSIAILRFRVVSRYYDRPQVIDALARAMVRNGSVWLMAES